MEWLITSGMECTEEVATEIHKAISSLVEAYQRHPDVGGPWIHVDEAPR